MTRVQIPAEAFISIKRFNNNIVKLPNNMDNINMDSLRNLLFHVYEHGKKTDALGGIDHILNLPVQNTYYTVKLIFHERINHYDSSFKFQILGNTDEFQFVTATISGLRRKDIHCVGRLRSGDVNWYNELTDLLSQSLDGAHIKENEYKPLHLKKI